MFASTKTDIGYLNSRFEKLLEYFDCQEVDCHQLAEILGHENSREYLFDMLESKLPIDEIAKYIRDGVLQTNNPEQTVGI